MAYTSQGSSSSSSSDSEVHTCSKDCLKSYETLQKQYDQQREALNKSNLEIIGYQMGLESLEARIVVHEKNEAVYEEDIAFLNRESDVDNSSINDRFKTGEGFHAVPPPYTGNYMPSRPDLSFAGLDDSVYKTKVSETETSISKTTVATKSGQVSVNAAKQSSPRAATSISTARTVNTAAPKPKKEGYANSTNRVSTVNPSVSAVGQGFDNADDQESIDSSTQDVNTVGPSINTASKNINTGSSNINTAVLS
ncbi:hypothetical protein Tco_0405746 [Tanacetum coccineum]